MESRKSNNNNNSSDILSKEDLEDKLREMKRLIEDQKNLSKHL